MCNSLVETSSLTKRYGAVVALDACTLEIRPGEVFGLLGPNGAGKTTLLRLLLGFLHPTSGWARIDGLDCHRHSVQVRQRLAYLPGEAHLFRAMRGREVLAFFADLRPDGNLERSLQLAERLDLDLSRQVGQMSTGMRQKLALTVTLSAPARLLLLDEPTANLDPTVRSEILRLVREAQTLGRTVVFSSHVLSEVEEICDRVVILRQGKVVHTQVMSELRRRHRIRAELAGELPPAPPHLQGQLVIQPSANGAVTIETPGELSPLLGWLATLPLREVIIEPIGLRTIYELYHRDAGE